MKTPKPEWLKGKYKEITVLDERQYKGRTIVLGKDRRQHMIGVKQKYMILWKKFFTNLPPADKFGGSYGLAREYFYDPDGYEKDFGPLFHENEGEIGEEGEPELPL